LGSAGAPPSQAFRRLKSALSFFVINYGLKSVAWFAFGHIINYRLKPIAFFIFAVPLTIHATGFSQRLMTDFWSAEFIRRQLGEAG